MYAAQAAGCAPVVRAIEAGLDYPEPVRPDTLAKSIAIGNPADGFQVIQSIKSTGGTGTAVSDRQIVDAIRLLAETEGIFTEPAGGTTLAAAIELIACGVIPRDESIVVSVTGNGYKTSEVVANQLTTPVRLSRRFNDFEAWLESRLPQRRARELDVETIGSLNSIARPLRSTLTVAVVPIFASATTRENCAGSEIVWPLNPTITSPGLSPAS